jgi:hypothetical protein
MEAVEGRDGWYLYSTVLGFERKKWSLCAE